MENKILSQTGNFRRWAVEKVQAFNAWLTGFRTFIVALLIGLVGVIEQTPWADLIPQPYKQWALVIVPMIFFALRFFTNTGPGQRQ